MSTVLVQREEVIKAPELRGAVLRLFDDPGLEQGVDGAAGCVAGETRIYNPLTGEHTPIKELYEKKIAPTVQTLMGAMPAEVPFRKGVRDLYRVTLASGRQCIVTENHIFLTSNGWDFLSSCVPGSRLLISAPCPDPTTEVLGPLVSQQDALRLSRIPLGFQGGCPAVRPGRGEPPLREVSNVLTLAPSQADAHVHSRVDQHMDDRGISPVYSHPHQQSDLHARSSYFPLSDDTVYILSRAPRETSLPIGSLFRSDAPFQKAIRPPLPIAQPQPDGGSMHRHAPMLTEYPPSLLPQRLCGETSLVHQQSLQYSLSSDMNQESVVAAHLSDACNLSILTSNDITHSSKGYYTGQWDTVSSIEYVRTDEYFDLHVPIANHYLAEGIWHHNTGKTFGIMYVLHCLLSMYPGTKWLVARKRHVDLVGSALATFRESVLDERENVHFFSGNKERPAAYEYPNGSLMVVNGLDRPGKVKSMDFDGMYICEATDCDLEDIEMCHIRLARRKDSKLPRRFQKLLMDFNPSFPDHFLNLRMNSGLTHRLNSRHEDNPFLYDIVKQDWTEAGRRYIAELETLTGARLARYRYGIWASSEGAVYEDSFDRARNVIAHADIKPEYPRYLVVDFGFVHPFVCLWAARDNDGRLIVYRQIYHTKKLVEDHAKDIAIASGWFHLLPKDHARYQERPADWADPLPRDIICDHDSEDKATLERHLRMFTTPAKKTVSDGIQAVAARLRPAGDGKPRLMIVANSVVERDQERARIKKPTCTEDEFDSYTWDTRQGMKKGEQPVKELDDGMDCIRYLCAYHDLSPTSVTYYRNIWS